MVPLEALCLRKVRKRSTGSLSIAALAKITIDNRDEISQTLICTTHILIGVDLRINQRGDLGIHVLEPFQRSPARAASQFLRSGPQFGQSESQLG